MQLKKIETEVEYNEMLQWLEQNLDKATDPESPLGQRVKLAIELIVEWEDVTFLKIGFLILLLILLLGRIKSIDTTVRWLVAEELKTFKKISIKWLC